MNTLTCVRNDLRPGLPRLSRMSKRLALETTLLHHAGVVAVGACYEGEDGEGTVSEVVCLDADKNDISHAVSRAVRGRIESFFRTLLDERYSTWREGHGAQGRFLWLLEPDLLEHEHEVRCIAYKAHTTFNL
jgi:hypothetical protein